jgi:hypothetical protein
MPRPRNATERFFEKVQKTDSCWLWTAATTAAGYGCFKVRSHHLVLSHRWSYEYHVGPIPDGLTIDHLCRTPACVNPEHMEAVSQAENNRRVPRPSHCPAGHEFTPENTQIRTVNRERGWTGRACITCVRERVAVRSAEIASGEWVVTHKPFEMLQSRCLWGHEYTPENTYVAPSGRRDCRTCVRARVAAYKARRIGSRAS